MNKAQPVVIDNRYLLTSLHYQGSHSNFYNAVDTQQEQKSILIQIITDQHCICKLFKRLEQTIDVRDKQIDNHNRMSKQIPIPRIYKMGTVNVQDINHHYIAWQKSGPSLKLCFKLMKCKFSIKTIALIALKMITNLQQIHHQNILHRSLNLSCIMTTNHSNLLITNFDNYIEFLNKNGNISTKKAVPIKLNKFSSLGQHLQQIPSPKDDLESLGYLLLYLLSQGKLPPKCQTNEPKDKYYMEFKRSFLPEKEMKQYPEPFLQYFQLIHKLGLKEIPNYEFLKLPFIQFLGRMEQDLKFDWNEIMKQQAESPQTSNASEAFIRNRNVSIETLLIQNFKNDTKDQQENLSAPTSPKSAKNKKPKSAYYTLAPILEKNESVATNQYYADSNCVSPKFSTSIANLMMDVCEHSSSGEMTPKDDEPTVEELPSFEQHDHFYVNKFNN